MLNRIILDISNYIFVADELQKVDAIFLPGGSNPEQPEYAAQLYHEGYAKWIIPSIMPFSLEKSLMKNA